MVKLWRNCNLKKKNKLSGISCSCRCKWMWNIFRVVDVLSMQADFHREGSKMLRVRSSRLQTGSESVDPNKRKLQSGIPRPERILHKRLQRTSLEWYESLILIVLYQLAYLPESVSGSWSGCRYLSQKCVQLQLGIRVQIGIRIGVCDMWTCSDIEHVLIFQCRHQFEIRIRVRTWICVRQWK